MKRLCGMAVVVVMAFGGVLRGQTGPATVPAGAGNGAKLLTDVEYGRMGEERLLLDVSVPSGEGPFGVVVMVHGGGWSGGDKAKDVTPVLEAMTGKVVWFSINYRMAPKYRWPACLEDVEMAVAWVKEHAGKYKGDGKRVVLMGHSAGGHLACLAALTADKGTQVQGVVGLAPVTDFLEDTKWRGGLSTSLKALLNEKEADERVLGILKEMSPLTYVHKGAPPFLLLQGSVDKTVPPEQTEAFAKKLKEDGVAVEYDAVADAPHAITAWDKTDGSYRGKLLAWLEKTVGDGAGK